jgi:hypothetical protein
MSAKCALGTVRLRRQNSGKPVAFVKVAATGDQRLDWRPRARIVWDAVRPPPGPGECVYHVNGDTTDDRLENLAVGTSADRIATWHVMDPKRSAAQLARAHAAAGRRNRERARVLRATRIRPSYWYATFPERELVLGWGEPTLARLLWRYRVCGLDETQRKNGARLAGVLGWPEEGQVAASALAALLATGRPMTGREIIVHANWIRARYLMEPLNADSLWTALVGPRRRGLLVSTRHGQHGSTYALTAKGVAAGRAPWRFVPMRGESVPAAWQRAREVKVKSTGKFDIHLARTEFEAPSSLELAAEIGS